MTETRIIILNEAGQYQQAALQSRLAVLNRLIEREETLFRKFSFPIGLGLAKTILCQYSEQRRKLIGRLNALYK